MGARTPERLRFRILGPLEVTGGDGPIQVAGAKERALLADLLVNAGRVVPADRLIDDLWGEHPPGNPVNALQGRVSQLRRALGPSGPELLVHRSPGYMLAVEPEAVDAASFERLAAEAGRMAASDPGRAAVLLAEALGRWRGPALAEFADLPFAQAEATRLEELRLAAVETRVELDLAAGRHGKLIAELETLTAAQPHRERPRAQLMLALYRSGRQAEALRAYQDVRTVLAEELGIDPSPELQRLHKAILDQDPSLDLPAPVAPDGARHNLPERLTGFVGRDAELGEVARLLKGHRLITLTGPGGTGKTSLGIELAKRLVASYPDGAWLVELAVLRDPAFLPGAIAAAVGLSDEPGGPDGARPAERLAAGLRDKTLLLVLDNCEHLVGPVAELTGRLLAGAPGLTVLATSREVLGVAGELLWPVPPLAVPGPDEAAGPERNPMVQSGAGGAGGPDALGAYDAVRLFTERARLAVPGFVLDEASGPAVAEICRRLDGLPLAIELAAVRVKALPAREVAARLDDRFRLLTGGPRTADARQRTLRATIDWSWELLEAPDRVLLRRLAVFAGGCTLEAAEAVCAGDGLDSGEILDGLFRLVERSLLVAAGGEPARFRMLDTLRAYALERLAEAGETGQLAGRHATWFTDLAEQAAERRTAPAWLLVIERDYDNLAAAMDTAVAGGDDETALRLAGALGWYWATRRHQEGTRRVEAVLEAAGAGAAAPTVHLARAVQTAALLGAVLTPTRRVADTARRSIELFERLGDGHQAAISKLWLALAEAQMLTDGGATARRAAQEAEATCRQLGDRWGEAAAWLIIMSADTFVGRAEEAAGYGRRALARFRALDDPWGRIQALFQLGMLSRALGDRAEAEALLREALAGARRDGPSWVVAGCLLELGSLAAELGDLAEASRLHQESSTFARRAGLRRGLAHAANEAGIVARAAGDLARARRLHLEALGILREAVPFRVPRALALVAAAEVRLGDLDQAARHLGEAATIVLDMPQPPVVPLILATAASLVADRGGAELAAELLGAAESARERVGADAASVYADEAALATEAARASLDPATWRAASEHGRALSPEAALRTALDLALAHAPGWVGPAGHSGP
jgi:predicted ATPase/DNA-binding SARP family transcriptional activator